MGKKIKMTKLSVIGVVVSIMMITVSPVFADWSNVETSGSWQIADRTSWQTVRGMESGSMEWNYTNITDFSGYSASINFSWLVNEGNWYEPQTVKKLEIVWNISNIYVCISCEDVKNFGGALDNMWFYAGSSVNNSGFSADWWNWWSADLVRSHTDFNRNWQDYYEVFVSKSNTTTVLVEVYKHGLDGVVRSISNYYTVDASFWNGTDVSMKIWHEGKGYLKGGMSDTIHTGSWSPDIPSSWGLPSENVFYDFFANLFHSITSVLPSQIRNGLNQMGAWSGYLISIVSGILFSITSTIIPFLPLILIFYVLDAGLTSVYTGSFTPLGSAFLTLYQLVATIIQVIVTISHAIYSFIHFW
jgi:hypothetical protein